MPTVDSVESDALQLSVAERALLVERLIASLDADPAVEAAWAAEIDRRLAGEDGATDSDDMPVPESHIRLVKQRLEAYRRDPSRVRPAFAIIDELMNRRP